MIKERIQIVSKYFFLLMLVSALYCLGVFTGLEKSTKTVQLIMLICLILCAIMTVVAMQKNKTEKYAVLCTGIVIAGLIMRIGYMIYTPCNCRSHDIGVFTFDAHRHDDYILTLMLTHKLPNNNYMQFYQQPFFYICGSTLSSFLHLFLQNQSYESLVNAAKCVSCFASCSTLFVSSKFCDIYELKGKGRAIALSLVAFLPCMYMTSSVTNPDALTCFFMSLQLLYTVRWHRKPTLYNAVVLAIFYGLGVNTKISCAVPALITIVVFIYHLYKNRKTKALFSLVLQGLLFSLISLPLGLWYSVRNYILFAQPLTYVLRIEKSADVYIGNYSIFSRLLYLNIADFFTSPYVNIDNNFSMFPYLIKTAVFDEFRYSIPSVIPTILLLSFLFLTVLSVVLGAYYFIKNRIKSDLLVLPAISILLYINLLWFCNDYAFVCSYNFRYYQILILPLGIQLGKVIQDKYGRFSDIITVITCFYVFSSIVTFLQI